ncbi:MAG: F0F1 ATP synthase subunit alpha [bacterium]
MFFFLAGNQRKAEDMENIVSQDLKEILSGCELPLVLMTSVKLNLDFVPTMEQKLSEIAERKIHIKVFEDPKQDGTVLFLDNNLKINLDIRRSFSEDLERKLQQIRTGFEAVKLEDIGDQIRKIISSTEPTIKVDDIGREGTVLQVGDGIARVSGLNRVGYNEVVQFEGGGYGLAFNLERDAVGVILLCAEEDIEQGSRVTSTGKLLEIPVGEGMIGRIVNPLGVPIDGKGSIIAENYRPIERKAPGVVMRQPVREPLQTGIKAIDSMIPIGRGQRELIIGDRKIGKTAIVIDTILNQMESGVVCIYVAIGQKAAAVAKVVHVLQKAGALKHTIVVAALANEQTAFRFLAPYAGAAIGEEFMEKGRHAVVFYDDLSKHAVAYREMSALLKRPIGREAYPGDIFYIHSRLLERAAKLRDDLGGGSLTSIPIVETLGGDVTGYISTNVISITDGQIYLESDLFNTGFRPSINVGLSVSRVGGAAQMKAMKDVAGRLRIDLSQYHEMAAFVKFGAEVDDATRAQLARGERGRELLKQMQYEPMPVEEQISVLFACVNGFLEDIPVRRIKDFEKEFLDYIRQNASDLLNSIVEKKILTEDIQRDLAKVVIEFKKFFMAGGGKVTGTETAKTEA